MATILCSLLFAKKGVEKCLRSLLELSADFKLGNESGGFSLYCAVDGGYSGIVVAQVDDRAVFQAKGSDLTDTFA